MSESKVPPASGKAPSPPTPPQKPPQKPPMLAPMRTTRFWVTLAILFAANIILSNLFFSSGQPPTVTISYNAFLQQVSSDNVVSVTSTAESIAGNTKTPVKDSTSGQASTKFQTQRPAFATDNL